MTAIKWPLFLTLTMPNNDDPAALKILSKVFAKFRRGKWWRQRDVKGGVACFEITNKGNGWHPHLHALIDCKWLASTPPPSKHCSGRENKRRSREAQEELSRVWGSHIGYEGPAVVWAKRAAGQDIAQEIAKYAVKGSDLAALGKDACRVIDVLAEMRTMITWGSLRPLGPIFEAWEKDQEILYDGCECDRCHATGWVVPDNVYQMMVRAAFAR